MFIYVTTYILVFVLTVLAVFCFYASLSIDDLKHNNNLLTSLLLSLGDGFYLWDEKKRVERFSPNLQMLLNSIFCSFNELANFFEESEQLRKNFAEARKINKSFTVDLKGRDAEIYCSCYGQSIVDDQDKIVGVLLWIQNVTGGKSIISNLKRENAKLKQELANCKDIIDTLPYPVWKRSETFELKVYNPFCLKLMQNNKSGGGLFAKHCPRVNKKGTAALQEKASVIVNNERRLYSLMEKETDKGVFIGYGQDITENLHLLQEVKGYTQMQQNLLSILPCAVAIYSSDGKLLFFNSHFSNFWQLEESWMKKGATYSEIAQKIYESGLFIDDDALELIKKQQYEFFGKLSEPYHDTLILKNGITLEISIVPNHRQELLFIYMI